MSQLKGVTCHTWSHSVICLPTGWHKCPPQRNPSHTGRYSI